MCATRAINALTVKLATLARFCVHIRANWHACVCVYARVCECEREANRADCLLLCWSCWSAVRFVSQNGRAVCGECVRTLCFALANMRLCVSSCAYVRRRTCAYVCVDVGSDECEQMRVRTIIASANICNCYNVRECVRFFVTRTTANSSACASDKCHIFCWARVTEFFIL